MNLETTGFKKLTQQLTLPHVIEHYSEVTETGILWVNIYFFPRSDSSPNFFFFHCPYFSTPILAGRSWLSSWFAHSHPNMWPASDMCGQYKSPHITPALKVLRWIVPASMSSLAFTRVLHMSWEHSRCGLGEGKWNSSRGSGLSIYEVEWCLREDKDTASLQSPGQWHLFPPADAMLV